MLVEYQAMSRSAPSREHEEGVWGDPRVRGEGESWVRAGKGSLGMLPLDLGDLGDLGWDFFFFFKENEHFSSTDLHTSK